MAAERETVQFVFVNAGSPILIWVYALLALGLCWWAWRRYGPAPGGPLPGVLARLCRMGALVTAVLLLMAPAWRTTTLTYPAANVLVAVDRSASMDRKDGPGNARRIAAAAALRAELDKALGQLQRDGRVRIGWFAIGGQRDMLEATQVNADLPATGSSSPLGSDLLELANQHPSDVAVLVSDGRVNAGSSMQAAMNELRQRDMVVYALGVGTELVESELRIEQVVLPAEAPRGERQPVRIKANIRAPDATKPMYLVLKVGDREVERREVKVPQSRPGEEAVIVPFEVEAQAQFDQEGEQTLTAELVQGELHSEASASVSVRERKLKVLLLCDQPRQEFYFLREALRRDKTVQVHSYAADLGWRRWGDASFGPEVLPLKATDLRDYDAVVLADVPPERLKDAQRAVVDAVKQGGTGLVWVAGEGGALSAYPGQPLGELLPARVADLGTIQQAFAHNEAVKVRRTKEAIELGLFTPGEKDWPDLPELWGVLPFDKATWNPLAKPLMEDSQGRTVVLAEDVGAGRTLLLGIDDTWRWRRNVGDEYLHRFYSQLLRYVSANRNPHAKPWRINVQPHRAEPGLPVRLSLGPTRPQVQGDLGPRQVLRLRRSGSSDEVLVEAPRERDGAGYVATLSAPGPGRWIVEPVDGNKDVAPGELHVSPSAAETFDPRIDKAALAEVEQTGGTVYADAAALAAALARQGRLLKQDESVSVEPVWDSWWAFAVLVGLLAIEWSLRRLNRLP